MEGMIVIMTALLIDGLQGTLSWMFVVTLGPVGAALGLMINLCLSLVLGAILGVLMKYFNMFYPRYFFGGGGIEIIPGLDIVPGWTALAIASVLRKKSEKSGMVRKTLQSRVVQGIKKYAA